MTHASRTSSLRTSLVILSGLAAIKLALHFLTNGTYGVFRDEYYYIACSDRLAWGYVDQPPLSIFLLRLVREVLGESVFAIRLLAVLAETGVVVLTGLMARAMGGGVFAQGLAALAALITPVFLALAGIYSMNALDHFFWALALYIVVLIVKTDNPRLWLLFGLVAGLGLENKLSMLFLGFGLAVGLLLTPERRYLKDKHLWLGAAIALALFLPHVAWQVANGAPTLEFVHNAATYKNVHQAPLAFLGGVTLIAHPFNTVVMILGVGFLLFSKEGRPYRLLGWVPVAVLALFILQEGAKTYYVGPVFPVLLAAGAIVMARFTGVAWRRWLRAPIVGLLVVGGALSLPLTVPLVPIERYTAYEQWLGIRGPQEERSHTGRLPQIFSDRFGWKEMTETVANVYQSLGKEDRARTVIFTRNYGEAGALELHGRRYGLPPVVSGHNNYYLWGPGDTTAKVVITVGIAKEDIESVFGHIEVGAIHQHPFAMPEENNIPILVCREPKRTLQQIWPRVKHFI